MHVYVNEKAITKVMGERDRKIIIDTGEGITSVINGEITSWEEGESGGKRKVGIVIMIKSGINYESLIDSYGKSYDNRVKWN